MKRVLLAALAAALVAPSPASAAPLALERVGTFSEPVYATGVPGSPRALVVVERYGRVLRVDGAGRRARRRVLLDLRRDVRIDSRDETVDQRGLLSVALPPDFARTRRIYVDYVDRAGRLRVEERDLRTGAARTVLDLGQATTQHHGGQLEFGPDGLLYVSTGMGDDPPTSQDPASPGGKILRVDARRPGAVAEVHALGLRNPWRFSFDPVTRAMLIGDVGESTAEEVDVIPGGAAPGTNFGWPGVEGRTRLSAAAPPTATPPAIVHRHGRAWCSITGGYVGRRNAPRALRGRYVYADLCSGRLWSARFTGTRLGSPRRLALRVPYIVSFGRDTAGELYAVSLNGGVWRLR